LQQALQAAKGKAVMLDFYADWCTSCKEMEANTFPDSSVQTALQGVVLLKADVTRNTAEDKAMMRHFKVVGPPATLFFSREGEERISSRQVGFLAADAFAAHVRKAVQ
jgi:thiol:disulfide interchange protein DsbD